MTDHLDPPTNGRQRQDPRLRAREAHVDPLEADLDQARRQIAALAPHNRRGSSQLVPTRQGLVPWRHPLDFTIPTGGA